MSLAVTLPVTSPSTITDFGEHLRLDSAVRTNRQHVFLELNGPLDVALNRQVFAAVQLALDDD